MNIDQIVAAADLLEAPLREPTTIVDPSQWPPDYREILRWRQVQLLKMRADPMRLAGALEFYKTRPEQFINHWGVTYDPRNANTGVPTKLPFILFKKQAEFVRFIAECIRDEENGLGEKCRDVGVTWIGIHVSWWLWRFWKGAAIGWGSRKQELVDKIGDPDSIFEKIRMLTRAVPPEFLPRGFDQREHMKFMELVNPDTGATITGEIGDNIGRGGRKLVYLVDEADHLERAEMIEASLADNTRVRIDVSSVNGIGTVFDRKREAGVEWSPGGGPYEKGRTRVFVFDWRDHPAKTQEWYDTRRKTAKDNGLLHVLAQEVDRDRSASLVGVIIPADWVKAAIDAHKKLPAFDPSGAHVAALDVADEGGDVNALSRRRGVVLRYLEEWGDRDTGVTTRTAVKACEGLGRIDLQYDCIGVGAGVKAESNRLIEEGLMRPEIRFIPWNAGAEVLNPDAYVVEGDKQSPTNREFYANLKAQGWWMLRRRFELTYRALTEPDFTWDSEDLISLSSEIPLLWKLVKELSQPTAGYSSNMKLMINKKPEGSRSPNLADSVMMNYWPVGHVPMIITSDILARAKIPTRRRR